MLWRMTSPTSDLEQQLRDAAERVKIAARVLRYERRKLEDLLRLAEGGDHDATAVSSTAKMSMPVTSRIP